MTRFAALPRAHAAGHLMSSLCDFPTIVRTAVLTAVAAMLISTSASLSAQSIEPYYADTSDYDFPRFRVADTYSILTPGCFDEFEVSPTIAGITIRLAVRLEPRPNCGHVSPYFDVVVNRVFYLGTRVPAGSYSVEFGYLLDGAWIPRVAGALAVDDGKNKCSRMPEANTMLVETVSNAVADRIAAVAVNPALDPALYEALLRPVESYPYLAFPWVNLTYFALDDFQDIARRVAANSVALGVIQAWATDGFVCFLAYNTPLEIVEFFNTQLGHYFFTADTGEMAFIDNGGAGPGWQRTGEKISGFVADVCSNHGVPNPTPLYRFYGVAGRGPNSHFFTADRSECGQVRKDPGWAYEATSFRVWATERGRCPVKSLPVFRLYNDRAAQNDSNHRYTAKLSIVNQMVASGWKNEGATFCIPQS